MRYLIVVAIFMLVSCIPGTPMFNARTTSEMTPQQLESASESNLCVALFYDHPKNANIVYEIKRRNLMSQRDWELFGQKKIGIGMSLCALRAVWGPAIRQHQYVNANGVMIQRVYGQYQYGGYLANKTYVYVQNGVVTSFNN